MVLFIFAVLFLICALILFVLHFVIGIDLMWFSLSLIISALLNLIFAIIRLKQKRTKDNFKDKNCD